MKRAPLLFTIPVIAIVAVLAIVFGYKILSARPVSMVKNEFPNSIGSETSKKPKSFLGGLFQSGATPSPTPATAVELSNELKSTYDDGGQSDLDSIAKDASSL